VFFSLFRPFWVDAGKCLTADIAPTDPLGENLSIVVVAVVVVVVDVVNVSRIFAFLKTFVNLILLKQHQIHMSLKLTSWNHFEISQDNTTMSLLISVN
jgi:hypothetical protein